MEFLSKRVKKKEKCKKIITIGTFFGEGKCLILKWKLSIKRV